MQESKAFNWDDLLERIAKKNIIPVIGPGLYRIEKPRNAYLYDHLADRIAEDTGCRQPPGELHRFSNAAFRFLKKHDDGYPAQTLLIRRLTENLEEVVPLRLELNPLMKLARIKSFDLFIIHFKFSNTEIFQELRTREKMDSAYSCPSLWKK